MSDASRTVTARGFVRSLNTLLKFTRLYSFDHVRSKAQLDVAWNELQTAVLSDTENGVLLSAIGTKLLLDGAPMDSGAPGRAFAQMLSSAGVASVHFLPQVTIEELSRFAQAFPTGGAKPETLLENLKSALGASAGIRINEVRFIREDSASPESKLAAQLMMRSLGTDAAELKAWFDDPQKLLQLILAADTSRGASGPAGASLQPTNAGADTAPGAARTGVLTSLGIGNTAAAEGLTEDDLQTIMALLKTAASKARLSNQDSDSLGFQQRVSELPAGAQFSIQTALAVLAAQSPNGNADQPTLLKLAERLAVQYALEKVESGDAQAGAVHQMFIRMSGELEGLREIIESHEEKLGRAGIAVESYAETLGTELWTQVSDEHKKAALLSSEAWCCPPKVVRLFVRGLRQQGEEPAAYSILQNYASCIAGEDAETRRCAATGVSELADLYGEGDDSLLEDALGHVGTQMARERDARVHALINAAFVRLAQEAAARSCYPAILRALDLLAKADHQRPGLAESVEPRMGIEARLSSFIADVLATGRIPAGLTDLLCRTPRPAVMALAKQFNQCLFHDECASVVELTESLGQDAVSTLSDMLASGPPTDALEGTGLLSRLDVPALERSLPSRLRQWSQSSHDRLVRYLASAGSAARGHLLCCIFEMLDPFVRPLALDEIGFSGDESLAPWLMSLLDEKSSSPYVQLKVVEALNRLRAHDAIPLLHRLAETKRTWRWVYPQELRIVALQGLENLDPEWVRGFLPRSGITRKDLNLPALEADPYSPSVRQRRYGRVRMKQPVSCETTNLGENARLQIRELNLSGGLATCERRFASGTVIGLKIGLRRGSVRLQAFVRRTRANAMEFEIADISLEDRAKLRRFVSEAGDAPQNHPLQSRKRRPSANPSPKR